MANITTPRIDFDHIDCLKIGETYDDETIAEISVCNIAAVIAAEHLRSNGYRGFHMIGLIALASTAINRRKDSKHLHKRKASHVYKLIEPEREAWRDDLADDEAWKLAKAICCFFAPPDDTMPSLTECVALPDFLPITKILSCYANAVSAVSQVGAFGHVVHHAFRVLPNTSEHQNFAAILAERLSAISREDAGLHMSLEDAWGFARKPFDIPKHEVTVGKAATPEEVKLRRMERGCGGSAVMLKAVTEKHDTLKEIMTPGKSPAERRAVQRIGLAPIIGGDLSQVYCSTFMRADDYDRFLKDGVYRDVWSRGTTWHTRYHDRPLAARAFAEMRTFGERGDGITYGYLTTCDEWQDEITEVGVRSYGEVEVYWKPSSVLPHATATLEDSMNAHYMIDANHANSLAYLVLCCVGGSKWATQFQEMHPLIARMRAAQVMVGRFIEFQCHAPLTPNDIESIVRHEPQTR